MKKTESIMPKMKIMQPMVINVCNTSDKNVGTQENRENLCENKNYHDCDNYNTEFCRQRCKFGVKEPEVSEFNTEQGVVLQKIDSFDFDNREDGK